MDLPNTAALEDPLVSVGGHGDGCDVCLECLECSLWHLRSWPVSSHRVRAEFIPTLQLKLPPANSVSRRTNHQGKKGSPVVRPGGSVRASRAFKIQSGNSKASLTTTKIVAGFRNSMSLETNLTTPSEVAVHCKPERNAQDHLRVEQDSSGRMTKGPESTFVGPSGQPRRLLRASGLDVVECRLQNPKSFWRRYPSRTCVR